MNSQIEIFHLSNFKNSPAPSEDEGIVVYPQDPNGIFLAFLFSILQNLSLNFGPGLPNSLIGPYVRTLNR